MDDNEEESVEDSMIKNKDEHDRFPDEQAQKLYEKMKFYLDCDFNLFLYGVGTKKNFLNSFVLSQLKEEHVGCVINGYHSGTTIKAVVREMEKFVKEKLLGRKAMDRNQTTQDTFEFVKRIFNEVTEDKYEI